MVRIVRKIKHVSIINSRGKAYAYFRKNGKQTRMQSDPADIAALEAEAADLREEKQRLPTGTIGRLIQDYKESTYYPPAQSTRDSYERIFTWLAPLHASNLTTLTRPNIFKLRDKIHRERGIWLANYFTRVLRPVLNFGLDTGVIRANPLSDTVRSIRKPKGGPTANRIWAADERRAVLSAAPPHMALPLALMLYAGLRKGDALTATLSTINGGDIRLRTAKRGVFVAIPIHASLASALANRPQSDAMTISVNSRGNPWTIGGFDTAWAKLRAKLEAENKIAPGLTLHGARHTFKAMLHESNVPEDVRMKLLDHEDRATHARYAESAPIPEEVRGIIMRLDRKS